MGIVDTLIDKARSRSGITSDSGIANHFGVQRQAVSKWRNGDAYPDEEHIAALAEMAGEDPAEWLVSVRAVRSGGKAGKAWAALAKRLGAVAALIVVAALPKQAHATVAPDGFSQKSPGMHIMSTGRYYLGLLRDWLAQFLPRRKPANGIEAFTCL